MCGKRDVHDRGVEDGHRAGADRRRRAATGAGRGERELRRRGDVRVVTPSLPPVPRSTRWACGSMVRSSTTSASNPASASRRSQVARANRPVRWVSWTLPTVPSASRSRKEYSVVIQRVGRVRVPRPGRGSGRPGRRGRRCRRGRWRARRSRRCGRGRTRRRRRGGSVRYAVATAGRRSSRWSCSPRRRGRRRRRTCGRGAPCACRRLLCSHSGFSRRETSSISSDRSTSVSVEALLEVHGVVPAAAAELQHVVDSGRVARGAGGAELGLLGVLLGRGDQRPPRREVAVEAVARLGSPRVRAIARRHPWSTGQIAGAGAGAGAGGPRPRPAARGPGATPPSDRGGGPAGRRCGRSPG